MEYRKELAKMTAKIKKTSQSSVCQNISIEILVTWFKFQAKIPSHSAFRESDKIHPSCPPLTKGHWEYIV